MYDDLPIVDAHHHLWDLEGRLAYPWLSSGEHAYMGDYSALRHVPSGPVVGMGILSTKNPELESEDVLLRHLEEAGRFLDTSQLALCPQCGFASEAGGNDVDEDTQWRKLELVGRVADRMWGR